MTPSTPTPESPEVQRSASRTGEVAVLSYDTRIGPACDTLWSIAAPEHARYLGHSWGTSSTVSPTFWSVDFSPDGAEIASLSDENEYCNADGRRLAHLATRRIDSAGHAGASPTRVAEQPFGPPSRLIWIR